MHLIDSSRFYPSLIPEFIESCGAGPTLLALTDVTNAVAVVREMAAAWMEFGVKAEVIPIS
ncbi:hypothetical protein QT970_29620 [Microcoleus sp. herbarium8]|uniref:hypothetical protein n=1 Tax=Microcoleus sp. herbarium8 TaxID=3055436 RepID=UPI002FD0F416